MILIHHLIITNSMQKLWFVWLILGLVLVIVWALMRPWNTGHLTSKPHPVESYPEALQRIQTLVDREGTDLNPACRLKLMTHGERVARVLVLVHGYTSCPEQYSELGKRFYDLGDNVLIAPLPHHGLADRMTEEQGRLKAEEVVAYADEMVDIAQGLGERVVMAGISGGGVTTAWAAQNRSDLDLAVIISPPFGYHQVPTALTAAAMNLYLLLPNSYGWWDPSLQAEGGPAHAYPRYFTHSLAELQRVGFAVQSAARRASPAAGSLLVVTNANDFAINNELTAKVVEDWRKHGANLTTYEFEAALQLQHDLIDPYQPDAQIDIVYPRLIELISK
jgi:carboxylesterase